jgi:hypothetical protein
MPQLRSDILYAQEFELDATRTPRQRAYPSAVSSNEQQHNVEAALLAIPTSTTWRATERYGIILRSKQRDTDKLAIHNRCHRVGAGVAAHKDLHDENGVMGTNERVLWRLARTMKVT